MAEDVIIIGGGVIGLSIARSLKRSGVSGITVLDRGPIGLEASWAAAGMLGPQAETDAPGTFFEMCSESRDLYPAFADELLDETGIDIELNRTGTLYLSFDEASGRELLHRYRWQRDAGLAVESLNKEDILRLEPNVSSLVEIGLLFPNDWQVENRKLVEALARYAGLNGIDIREGVDVREVIVENGRAVGVRTADGVVTAEDVILATGAWTSLIEVATHPMPFTVKPIRGQIVAFEPQERLFSHVIYSHRGYIVPRHDGRVLAGSTSEDVGFEKETTADAADSLRKMASEIASDFKTMLIADQWSGLRPYAADGLPVLGSIAGIDNLTVATAHYRNGILLAPLTGRLIADALSGKTSRFIEEYSPERFTSRRAAV